MKLLQAGRSQTLRLTLTVTPCCVGKTIFSDRENAKTVFNPRRLYVREKLNEFKQTDAGREATAKDVEAEREKLKEKFSNLTPDVLELYNKQARDHE
jgi:hypothetical protein